MTRFDQYGWFRDALISLLQFTKERQIPVRGGEWHRPSILAQIYSTGIDLVNRGLRLVWPKVGVKDSDHIHSLAVDLWIIDLETGKKILWNDHRYALMGAHWIGLGGHWAESDPYHFEIKGKPL